MNKLKILIADDEPKIVQLIIELIDWNKLNVELLDTVSNGYDAYEYAKNYRPDILISDIRMPVYDGIEVLQKLYEEEIHIPTLIISGYKQFDYAIQALKYGAQDFLIKPINANELNTAIEKICNNSTPHSIPKSTQDSRPTSGNDNPDWYRTQLILDCINQNIISNNCNTINQLYGTQFTDQLYQVIGIRIDADYEMHFPIDEKDFNDQFNIDKFFVSKIHKIYNKYITPSIFIENESLNLNNTFFAILNISKADVSKSTSALFEMHKELMKEFGQYANVIPIMAISDTIDSIEDLPKSFTHTTDLLNSKAMFNYTDALYYSLNLSSFDSPVFISGKVLKEFDQLILSNNSEKIIENVCAILAQCEPQLQKHPLDMSAFIFQLINLIRFCANKTDSTFSSNQLLQIQAIYYSRNDFESIKQFTLEIFEFLNWELKQNLLKESAPVQLVKEYVSKHYAQKVTLETLTDVTGLSSAYLSSIFKSETGETITDFITACRMDKAQELLLSTTMNISEIADNVGYVDARYFSKIFIKSTGLRPMQYRKYNLT